MRETFPLDTVVTDPGLIALGIPAETLDESFRRNHRRAGTLAARGFTTCLSTGARELERRSWYANGDAVALTLGEVYALWVDARLDEIETAWDAALDAALAQLRDGTLARGEDFTAALAPHERRRSRARTAVTKLAYGVPYTTFTKETSTA